MAIQVKLLLGQQYCVCLPFAERIVRAYQLASSTWKVRDAAGTAISMHGAAD